MIADIADRVVIGWIYLKSPCPQFFFFFFLTWAAVNIPGQPAQVKPICEETLMLIKTLDLVR